MQERRRPVGEKRPGKLVDHDDQNVRLHVGFLTGNGFLDVVMPWLDHGIHSATVEVSCDVTAWIAGSSPAMTTSVGDSLLLVV